MKTRVIRTIIAVIVMAATLMTSGTLSFAMSAGGNDVKATEEELNMVVINQVISVTNTESQLEPEGDAIKFAKEEKTANISSWGKGVDLKNVIPLYDLDNQVTA